jgi:ABC-type Mn2+/Zn2+ transport system ATPase subunit
MSKLGSNIPVHAENVTFTYSGNPALQNISFTIQEGEFIAILGPNGAGKSTLLKLIAGLIKPDRGVLSVFGMYPWRQKKDVLKLIGYLPQRENIALDLPLTVQQVLTIPLKSIGVRVEEERVEYLLRLVGMFEMRDKTFSELSGGQQQRVLLARTLINEPKLLLLDEPFNGVDIPSQEKIIGLLQELARRGITVIAVVHNVNPLLHEITRVMLLNKRLIAFGRAEEVFTEENILKAYGARIPVVICDEGFAHPLYGDHHG